jgi:hypothetical protein
MALTARLNRALMRSSLGPSLRAALPGDSRAQSHSGVEQRRGNPFSGLRLTPSGMGEVGGAEPPFRAAPTAFSTHVASCSNRNESRSNRAAERIAPRDWQYPFRQCRARSRGPVCTQLPGPPIQAEASKPSEPTTPPGWSKRVSPTMFSVRITSKSLGRCTSDMAAESA